MNKPKTLRWVLARGLRLSLCSALTFVSVSALAEAGETKLVSGGIPHDILYALSLEGANGIAVGDYGLVMETADSGFTWKKQAKPATELGLVSVVRRQGHCIAGGQSGLILTSSDCKTWLVAPPVSKARMLSVNVNANGVAFAVGGFGAVQKSTDWGKSWQPISIDWKVFTPDGAEPHLYDVNVSDAGEITMIGEFELILRSKDGGATWVALHKGSRSLFSLKVLDNGEIYAVGQEGLILKSADMGKVWVEQSSGTKSVLTGVWAAPNGQAMVCGIYTILASSDGGKSWRMNTSKLAKALSHQAVAAVDGGKGQFAVLVGSGGAILNVRQ